MLPLVLVLLLLVLLLLPLLLLSGCVAVAHSLVSWWLTVRG
jgi:hypothetical protein